MEWEPFVNAAVAGGPFAEQVCDPGAKAVVFHKWWGIGIGQVVTGILTQRGFLRVRAFGRKEDVYIRREDVHFERCGARTQETRCNELAWAWFLGLNLCQRHAQQAEVYLSARPL